MGHKTTYQTDCSNPECQQRQRITTSPFFRGCKHHCLTPANFLDMALLLALHSGLTIFALLPGMMTSTRAWWGLEQDWFKRTVGSCVEFFKSSFVSQTTLMFWNVLCNSGLLIPATKRSRRATSRCPSKLHLDAWHLDGVRCTHV